MTKIITFKNKEISVLKFSDETHFIHYGKNKVIHLTASYLKKLLSSKKLDDTMGGAEIKINKVKKTIKIDCLIIPIKLLKRELK